MCDWKEENHLQAPYTSVRHTQTRVCVCQSQSNYIKMSEESALVCVKVNCTFRIDVLSPV